MSDYIKQIMDSPGWEELQERLDDKMKEARELDLSPNMPSKEYKILHLANRRAIGIVNGWISDIKKAGSDIKKEKPIKYQ